MAFIVILGCSRKTDAIYSDKEINTNEIKAIDNHPDQYSNSTPLLSIPEQPELGCYYALDDKYSDSRNEKEIESWWEAKLKSIKASGIKKNILLGGGAGPNGAEWNTYTDLYFALVIPTKRNLKDSDDLDFDPITVTLNDKSIDYKSIRSQSFGEIILIDFMLEKEVWTYALKSIEPEDYIPLFGKERVEEANRGEDVFGAPMSTGKMFKVVIEVELDNKEKIQVTDYFHIGHGE